MVRGLLPDHLDQQVVLDADCASGAHGRRLARRQPGSPAALTEASPPRASERTLPEGERDHRRKPDLHRYKAAVRISVA